MHKSLDIWIEIKITNSWKLRVESKYRYWINFEIILNLFLSNYNKYHNTRKIMLGTPNNISQTYSTLSSKQYQI